MVGEILKVYRDEKIFTRLVICEVKDGKICEESTYGIRFTEQELKKIMERMKLQSKKYFIGKKVFLMGHRIYILKQEYNAQNRESYTSYKVI